ncbi:aldo/keto reductase [Anoxybacter fermentans]|uniref:Aldo/keto reductase n=1 Tax=Anoxybacter fermentans TaxID=1323375 RepID=A0A3Q9HRH8_9FIRM|nr:aldo/keto reductase [Anoxybacter fermentans]AZR74127.1 aldo/keto reductase [Anoxybacter fermentans]
MQYRKFGNTGIEVSLLGFGAMRLPKTPDGKNYDHEEGVRVIRRALELGVNYVDTAPYYCNKESEVIVGKAIKGWRDKIYLSTKNPIEDDSGANWRKRLENSLKKLDVDYIDFYHMWAINWEKYTEKIDVADGPLQAALKAKDEGLIRHLSFSFHGDPKDLFKLIDTGYFASMTVQYNLLDRSNEEAIAYARKKGMGVVIMGPVGGGRLGYPSKEISSLVSNAVSTPELALRFVFSNPNVSTAISGMSTIEMVEENVKTACRDVQLTPEEKEKLLQVMEEKKKLADLYCTGCNYCMPCPQKVDISRIFTLMNYYRIYDLKDYAKKAYNDFGQGHLKDKYDASYCVECGACEKKCPQNLPIIRQLKEAHATLAE